MAESNPEFTRPSHVVGRYALYGRLAAGGMATVHLGRLMDPDVGPVTVAIKRLHPQFCKDPEFVAMFIDEARLAARIKHPNVVETMDILTMGQELLLVMEYIRGECFSKLLRAARRKNLEPSLGVVGRIASGMLHGLHAAHEARDDEGELLRVVHRDISPQNVMVGVDGVAKVLDFGVAKASARIQITRDGQMKGKLSYMSPEQLQGVPVDRRADIFAAGVVLWEALTRRRLFVGEDASEVLRKILKDDVPPPSDFVPELTPELDAVVLRALSKDPDKRYQTAEEAALDVERVVELASHDEVGHWIELVAGEVLAKRQRLLAEIERAGADEAALVAEGGGSVSDSDTFERIQSWAEREAAKVVAEDSDEIEVEPEDDDDAEEATQTYADGQYGSTLESTADAAGRDSLASLDGSVNDEADDPDTTVTLAQEQPFSLVDPAPAQAIVAPVAPLQVGRRRVRRLVALLAAAAGVVAVVAFAVVEMDRSQLESAWGALRPEAPVSVQAAAEVGAGDVGASEVGAGEVGAAEVGAGEVGAAEPGVAKAVNDDRVTVVPELPAQAVESEAEDAHNEDEPPLAEATALPGAAPGQPSEEKPAAIALTRPSKSLASRYRSKRAARRGRAAAQRRTKPPPRKRANLCREPYYFDDKGIKRLKMNCL